MAAIERGTTGHATKGRGVKRVYSPGPRRQLQGAAIGQKASESGTGGALRQSRRSDKGRTPEPGCSFCSRGKADVVLLVQGPGVWICDECILLCADLLASRAAVPSPPRGLDGFLRLSEKSHSREVLFRHRLCYELKAAAAMAGYHLHVFLPDADHEGFDLVCGDRERLHRVQLKTVLADTTKAAWSIHKGHFRAGPSECTDLGFPADLAGTGQAGGVLLQVIETAGEHPGVSFRYADVFVLAVFRQGVLRGGLSEPAACRLWTELLEGRGGEKFSLPAALFLRPRSPHALLTLMGIGGGAAVEWRYKLLSGLRERSLATGDPVRARFYLDQVRDSLSELVEDELVPALEGADVGVSRPGPASPPRRKARKKDRQGE